MRLAKPLIPLGLLVLLVLPGLAVLPVLPAAAQGVSPSDSQASGLHGPAIHLRLPKAIEIGQSVLLGGHVEAVNATWVDPQFVQARALALSPGNLTVCPLGTGNRSRLMELLAQAGQDCAQGQGFIDAQIRFGPGTGIDFKGNLTVSTWPQAAVAAPYGNGVLALLMEDLRLAAPDARFLPAGRQASVQVTEAGRSHWFNGTDHGFLFDGPGLRVEAAGGIGHMPGTLALQVTPGNATALERAMQPYVLLDLQSAALGPDAREARANVSSLLGEFGRVPQFANGAVYGRLAGQAGRLDLEGEVALLRGDSFRLRWSETSLNGTYEPVLAVTASGVAFGSGGLQGFPWLVPWVLWIACAAVLVLRREAPRRPWTFRLVWLGAGLLAFVAVDLAVLRARFGAGALGGSPSLGTSMALAAFAGALVLCAYLLLALPVRVAAGRMVPPRWLLASEAATAALWVFVMLLFPAAFFALGHAVARL